MTTEDAIKLKPGDQVIVAHLSFKHGMVEARTSTKTVICPLMPGVFQHDGFEHHRVMAEIFVEPGVHVPAANAFAAELEAESFIAATINTYMLALNSKLKDLGCNPWAEPTPEPA